MKRKTFSTALWLKAFSAVTGLCLLNQLAAAPGDVDSSFNPSVDRTVRRTVVQPDGKILIGGDFTIVNSTNRDNIARLNADGSLDTSFDSGLASDNRNRVYSIALQPDGKMLIGGFLITDNSTNNIVRLNTNGTLDATFNAGTDVSNYVFSIAIQPDGEVIIGGEFTNVNGTSRNFIARLNTNGSPDTSFDPGVGPNDAVSSIAIQPDGKVIIGGYFTTVGDSNRTFIARLNANGTLDNSFVPTDGADLDVESVLLQPDGKVLIGGWFTSVNGQTRNGIARLNADGSVDVGFDTGTGIGPDPGNVFNPPRVYSMALQTDGKLLIGGKFTTINETNRNRIARLNADGSLDTNFDPGTGVTGGLSPTIYSLALQLDDKVLLGGLFSAVNGTAHSQLARLIGDARLRIQRDGGGSIVVSWLNAGFSLQSAPFFTGTFTNVPGATSPYTNPATASQQYFRLKAD